jgi:hypothetical protein
MLLDSLFRYLDSLRTRPRAKRDLKRRNLRYRPRLEALEDRTLLNAVNWLGGSGLWSDSTHWLDAVTGTNHVPTGNDDAGIATGATVTHNAGTDPVQSVSVSSGNTLSLTGGTLNISSMPSSLSGSGTVRLAGGTLANANVASGTTITGTDSGGTLNGVNLSGNLDLTTVNGANATVVNGLTLSGSTVNLGNAAGSTSGQLFFLGSETLGGTGTVLLGGNAGNSLSAPFGVTTLTIGPNILVHGKNGSIAFGGETFVNQGTINADTAGGTISLGGTNWSNSGTITATSGAVNLGGSFTLPAPGMVNSSGGTVNLTGNLNNAGSTLAFTATTGSWNLLGGKIIGGTVTEAGGAKLTFTGSGGTLDGVTFNNDLDLAMVDGAVATVLNGLTLSGSTVNLGNAAGSTSGRLFFLDTETLGGTGTVLLGGNAGNSLSTFGAATLTIGPNILVHGKNGSIAFSGRTFVNQGTINADTAGGTITLDGTNWSNSGTITATSGTVNLRGSFTLPAPGTVNSSGGTINLTGTLNNTGSTLAFTATTGSWNLLGGTITGGTVTEAGGAKLIFTNSGGTLNGVTFNNDLDLATVDGAVATVLNGLTLSGSTVNLGNAAGSTFGRLLLPSSETLGGTGTVLLGGSAANGLLNFGDTTLTIGPNILVHGKNGSINLGNQAFVNQGTINADTAGGTITLNGTNWSNQGTIQASGGGTLNAQGTTTNFAAGTLTDGTWSVGAGSILRLTGAAISTNAANIVLDGANSNFFSDSGTTNALANLATNAAAGSFTIQNGRNFTTSGDFGNAGTLVVGANSTFTIPAGSSYTQTGTLNVLANGTMSVVGAFTNFSAGTLTGGTYQLLGTFQFANAAIATNAATIVLDGSSSRITDLSSADALANLATNGSAGSLTIQNGRNFTTAAAGTFNNAGTLIVGSNSTFTVPAAGTYGQTGTLSVLPTGTMNVSGTFSNFAGGTLTGGTYQIQDTFKFNNAAITTNAATIVLDGLSSRITDLSSNNALANLASNAAAGNFTIQNGRTFTTAAAFSNAGSLTVGNGSTFGVTGGYTQAGTANVLAGGTLTLSSGGSSSGTISVDGTLNLAAGTTLTVSGTYSQSGTLNLPATATLNVTGTFANFSSGTLTGGTYQIAGTLQFMGAAISTNAATIVLDGTGARIIDQSSNDALANFATNGSAGSFTIQNGRNFTASGSFSNAGSLTVGASSTFSASGSFTQDGTANVLSGGTLSLAAGGSNSGSLTNAGTVTVTGNFANTGTVTLASGSNFTASGNYTQSTASASTTLSGGTLAATLVDLQGGTLAGNGAITGNVRNAAQISLGTATMAGTLTISGTYTQTSAGILSMKIGGPSPTDSDQLMIGGAATLGGTLNVSLFNGFTPTSGSTFTLIAFASHGSTTFATTNLDPAFVNPPNYNATNVMLTAV